MRDNREHTEKDIPKSKKHLKNLELKKKMEKEKGKEKARTKRSLF